MINKKKAALYIILLVVFMSYTTMGQLRRSIYSDIKAHKVGDVITIIINEQTTSQNNSDTKTTKQNQLEIDSEAGSGFLNFLNPFSAKTETQNQYQGTGQVSSTGLFNSRMSARVEKVLEDGNYLISGTRVVDSDGEKRITEVSGIVRPMDISPSNSILSSQIANIHIYHRGSGVIEQGHRPGLFTRLINWIF